MSLPSRSGHNPAVPGQLNRATQNPIGPVVVLWDDRSARLRLINRVVLKCGGQLRQLESRPSLQQLVVSARCSVALVGLQRPPTPDALELETIRLLRQKGFKIISYEDGAQLWPLAVRALVLLAGSSSPLDSATKDFGNELECLLSQMLETEAKRHQQEAELKGLMRKLGLIGGSEAMLAAFRWIVRISAMSDLPALITGETGTGKELVARAIHQLDAKRRNGPFIALNCAALSTTLAESELFGHRRGAFTGAERDRRGLIRSADGGVLFLDEVGELDETLQGKLLRFLQENTFFGLGEDRETRVNVRVLAATNRNLSEKVQEKRFREDLYHRLNVLSIHISPLRDRIADLRPLVEHFLETYSVLSRIRTISADKEFIEALMQLRLPGNVRELENLVRRALANKEDDRPLNLSDLPAEVWQQLSEARRQQPPGLDRSQEVLALFEASHWNLSRSLQSCEKLLLKTALNLAHGNQSETARLLGITPRSVYNKVRKYNLHIG